MMSVVEVDWNAYGKDARNSRVRRVCSCWKLANSLPDCNPKWGEHRGRTRVSLAVATDWHACGEDLEGARVRVSRLQQTGMYVERTSKAHACESSQ
jgi:hypothetical protein